MPPSLSPSLPRHQWIPSPTRANFSPSKSTGRHNPPSLPPSLLTSELPAPPAPTAQRPLSWLLPIERRPSLWCTWPEGSLGREGGREGNVNLKTHEIWNATVFPSLPPSLPPSLSPSLLPSFLTSFHPLPQPSLEQEPAQGRTTEGGREGGRGGGEGGGGGGGGEGEGEDEEGEEEEDDARDHDGLAGVGLREGGREGGRGRHLPLSW